MFPSASLSATSNTTVLSSTRISQKTKTEEFPRKNSEFTSLFKSWSVFFPCRLSSSRTSCSQQAHVSSQNKFCLIDLFCSLSGSNSGKVLAALVLSFSLSRWSLSSFRRSEERLYQVPPPFCSISSSSDQPPVFQTQIRIKLRKAQAEMSNEEIDTWLETLKEEAMQRGVRKDIVAEALDGVVPSETIIVKDQNQPEKKLTVESYLKMMVNNFRISKGVQMYLENKALLEEVSAGFGVPASVLASIWGIESNYGTFQGSWNVIQALVTLAFNSPEAKRRAFFREELFHALFILDKGEGPAAVSEMKGSWAGAMGQCQFMPSSFVRFAVDYDKDGRKDIWNSYADVFASMANYLVEHGWQSGGKYAQKVHVPDDIDKSVCGLDVQKTVGEWINEFKVVPLDEGLQREDLVSLVAPDGPSGASYLVWENFRVIMKYNISTLYSLAVYELACEIDARAAAASATSSATTPDRST